MTSGLNKSRNRVARCGKGQLSSKKYNCKKTRVDRRERKRYRRGVILTMEKIHENIAYASNISRAKNEYMSRITIHLLIIFLQKTR
tara:strand:+ start:277 stop:534 length:258 start_codon:yes stop_codon:yes gene_type:complete